VSKIIIHPRPVQVYGPGKEPQSVRDAYDEQIKAAKAGPGSGSD